MFKKSHYILLLVIVFQLYSCSEKSTEPKDEDTVTDIDGNVYKTVKIGDQWWMAENLKVRHYRNGDAIPNVTDDTTWASLTTGAYCNSNNDTNNADIYGSLYNWYAVDDSRNLAPVGWHVPSDNEWQTLVDYLGGRDIAGGKMMSTSTIEGGDGLWLSTPEGATNESGFSALPGGYCSSTYAGTFGAFINMGYETFFWSSTEYNSNDSWSLALYSSTDVLRFYYSMSYGFSVRCVRD